MKVDCYTITDELVDKVQKKFKKVYKRGKPLKALIFSVKSDKITRIFLEKKQALARRLGFEIDVKDYPKTPLFQEFADSIRAASTSSKYQAIIIQRPLPPELTSPTLENFIPLVKEVEGQKHKTPYESPIGLTTLSIIKYIYTQLNSWEIGENDAEFFKRNFKKKFIVLAGRGETTGRPIANTLVKYKLALVITHSHTPNPDMFYKQADIVITCSGQPVLNYYNVKPNSVLINFGYRREGNKTLGDYDEAEIKEKVAYYTPIINGSGPVMLGYLMDNIVEAYKKQAK